MTLRQPIVAVLGHVDHGKTTLLDYVRGSLVAKGEAGLITQHIGASEIPIGYIKELCGPLLRKMNVRVEIPGLLFIDTPGHEAFTTLRKRGGAIADIAVLVIDVNEGIQPQTLESIRFLRDFKTPFIIALTKIDRIAGWVRKEGASFVEAWANQPKRVQDELEKKLYSIAGQLAVQGFESDRYDRVEDFRQKLSIIPVSGITGEGIPDLLMLLTGLAQRFLKDRLNVTSGEGKGTVLEVNEFKGLGTTIDVILYDGEIKNGDWLVIGIKDIVVTKIRAMLKPNPMKEMRVEKVFLPVRHVTAACGVKIAAPEIEKVVAGSPLRAVSDQRRIEEVRQEISEEVSEVEIDTENRGVMLKADTLGSLEALVKTLKAIEVPIRKAEIGEVTKQDVMEMKSLPKPYIFAFNARLPPDIAKIAGDNKVKVFSSDVIYRLVEGYEKWEKDTAKRREDDMLASVNRPGRFRIMPGYLFRQSKPAIVGVEVMKGIIKPGNKLKKEGNVVGEIKELQRQGENVSDAKAGEQVAVSIEGATVGRNIEEGDELDVSLSHEDVAVLNKLRGRLRGDELELIDELEG
ncbi:MAG: translation initiation factor IF-2 [Candidatus Aenigmarchaeota archaeon]|nr:translation initiation factor IF-2 [Candidatus Aenigmarchaeota archaeon]